MYINTSNTTIEMRNRLYRAIMNQDDGRNTDSGGNGSSGGGQSNRDDDEDRDDKKY